MIKLFEQFHPLDPYGEDDWTEFEYNENLSRDEKINAIKKQVYKSVNSLIRVDTDNNGQPLVYSEKSDYVNMIEMLHLNFIIVGAYELEDDFINFKFDIHVKYENASDKVINKICSYLFE